MQIFEVTYGPKKKVREALGGIVKALGSAATAAAGQYVQSKTGVDTSKVGANPYGAQKSQAAAAAKGVIAQQAKQQQKLWNTALTKTMQSLNVSDPRSIPSGTKQEIARSLMNQIHTNFLQNKLGRDYTRLPSYVDGSVQTDAQDIVNRMNAAKQDILNFNAPVKDPVKSLADWQVLSQAAYDAMALLQFNPGQGIPGTRARPTPQATQQTASQGVQQAQANFNKAGVNPATINQIQTVMGRLPPLDSNDQRTMDALSALGLRLK